MTPAPVIRPATVSDIAAITPIYAHAVLHGTASWEVDPPDETEMARRRQAILEAGFPYLVADAAGRVLGYAYASAYRPRAAYRATVEDSIYVSPDGQGRGVGLSPDGRGDRRRPGRGAGIGQAS